jgi:hypothetical protein
MKIYNRVDSWKKSNYQLQFHLIDYAIYFVEPGIIKWPLMFIYWATGAG